MLLCVSSQQAQLVKKTLSYLISFLGIIGGDTAQTEAGAGGDWG